MRPAPDRYRGDPNRDHSDPSPDRSDLSPDRLITLQQTPSLLGFLGFGEFEVVAIDRTLPVAVHGIGQHDEALAKFLFIAIRGHHPALYRLTLLKHLGKVVEVVAHQQHNAEL